MRTTSSIQWATEPLVTPRRPARAELAPFVRAAGLDYHLDARFFLGAAHTCGSFTLVLAKALERAGIEFRIAQMLCDGRTACHVLLEALVDGRWVVLDPLFDQAFVRPDGQLASFADVSADWASYQKQIPADRTQLDPCGERFYDTEHYDYAAVRYMNWNKIPIAMPVLRFVLRAVLGQATVDQLSARSYLYDKPRTYGVLTDVVCLLVLTLTLLRWRMRSRLPQPPEGSRSPACSG